MSSLAAESAGSEQGEFFRISVPLLRVLIHLGCGSIRPRDGLFLLALHAHAAAQPASTLERHEAMGNVMPSVTLNVRLAAVLELLGYRRRAGDFSSSAWERVRKTIARLAASPCRVAFKTAIGGKGPLVDRAFKQALVATLPEAGRLRVRLSAYSPPEDRYFVLVPSRLLELRPALNDCAIQLAFWLLAKHRGAKKGAKVVHRWTLRVTVAELADDGVIDVDRMRQARELARWRSAFELLQSQGLLNLSGDGWPFHVELSRSFFHAEGSET